MQEDKLRKLYPAWDRLRDDLRKLLTGAGAGFSPEEANAIRPDRARYRKLRASGPTAGFDMPDGVWSGQNA